MVDKECEFDRLCKTLYEPLLLLYLLVILKTKQNKTKTKQKQNKTKQNEIKKDLLQ